jgi:hypothetical protein
LAANVELTDERAAHIAARHPELANRLAETVSRTIGDPDEVRIDPRFPRTRLFSRWFEDLLSGRILVVATVTDEPGSGQPGTGRHWVVTAYAARRLTKGTIEWSRP